MKIFAFADEASAMIDEQIIAMKRNKLDGLEIRNVDGVNVADITLEKAKAVKKKMDDNGLSVWSIGSPIGKTNICEAFNLELERLKYTLEIANALNAKNVRIFSFYMPQSEEPRIYDEEVIERLGKFADVARGSGVNLCHENEKGIYGDVAERCLKIHQCIPEIKGIFDPANYVQCGVDTMKAWEMLKEYIHYLHIKDAREDGIVVPAGEGVGNILPIVKDYINRGGKYFTIEPHLAEFDGFKFLEREGEETKMINREIDSHVLFDIACNAFKKIIKYDERNINEV